MGQPHGEVFDPDAGSGSGAFRSGPFFGFAVPDLIAHGSLGVRSAGNARQDGAGGYRRQCFSGEAERGYAAQVVVGAELRGGVSRKGGFDLVGRDTSAVVLYPD